MNRPHVSARVAVRQVTAAALLILATLSVNGCRRDPQKFLDKGNQSFEQGKFPDALIYFGRAIQLNPSLPEAHYKLAQTHLKMKSWSAAFAELQRTVALQPDNWAAQLDLGRLEFAAKKFKDSRDRADLILKSNPNNIDAQMLLADDDSAMGNAQVAIEEANAAINMAPDRATSYVNLAQLFARAGNAKDAEINLIKAQTL